MSTTTTRRAVRKPGASPGTPVTIIDWLMLVLAIISVGLLVWITFWDVPGVWQQRVIAADYTICAIFLLEFCIRWARSGRGWRFPLLYWYEVVGMIPFSDPAFRAFRLLRIVAIVGRLMRAADRMYGDRVSVYVVGRFSNALVDAIRKPITVAVLDEVIAVVQTGNYTRHIAAAMEENRTEIDSLIIDLIRQDQTAGKLRYLPFHDDVVRLVADTVLRIADQGLADPRVHELISDAIRESAKELRANVAADAHMEIRKDEERFGK